MTTQISVLGTIALLLTTAAAAAAQPDEALVAEFQARSTAELGVQYVVKYRIATAREPPWR